MVQAGTASPPRFDSADPAVLDSPYSTYARLRASGPLCRFAPSAWGVTRHAEVSALLREPGLVKYFLPESYYEAVAGNGPASGFFQRMDIARGDPRVRQVLTHGLGAAASRRLAPRVEEAADRVLEPLLGAGTVDVVADLARPLVLAVLGELVGIPPQLRGEVSGHVEAMVRFGGLDGMNERTVAAADAAVERLREIVTAGLRERDRSGGDDLLARLAEVTADEEVRGRAVDNVLALLYAGLDTTTNLISAGCAALAEHPDQFERLREAPDAAANAVEEFLRYDAPIQVTPRMLRREVRVGDRVLRPGRVVMLMLGSANHDERVFREPERLDVLRHPNPHVSFGGGSFFCFGAAQARANATLLFQRIAVRCAALVPGGRPDRVPQFSFRSFARLPMRLAAT